MLVCLYLQAPKVDAPKVDILVSVLHYMFLLLMFAPESPAYCQIRVSYVGSVNLDFAEPLP